MGSTTVLQDLLAPVRPELERMNQQMVQDLRPADHDLEPLLEHVAQYQGKQLRPALVFLAAKMFQQPTEAHFTAAKVVELIHTATLVHDDILDGAALRRQMPTVNQLHGNEIPVLLGDYIYALAFHMAVSLPDPTCARLFSDAVRRVCQGEISQSLHRLDLCWNEERYYQVIGDKTASLYAAACQVGGHYAGASCVQAKALYDFGHAMGVAFQIIDDCLDLSGEEAVVGKSLGTDLDLGKLTLPLLYLQAQNAGDADKLRQFMGGPHSPATLQRLRQEFDLPAALTYAGEQAKKWVNKALQALADLPDGSSRQAMQQLADYVLQREL